MKLLLLLAVALLALAAPAAAQETASEERRTMTVSGEGSVFADNDVARFSLGVTTRRPTAGAALTANSTAMRRVIAAVRAQGVAEQDIRTSVVSLGRTTVRRRRSGPRRVVFVARNAVTVTVRALDSAGAIVDAAVRGGATNVSGPSFGLADPSAVYRDALALAFREARAKADRLAAEAGVRIVGVLAITEGGISTDDSDRGFDEQSGAVGGAPQTPTQPGRSRVTATVAVVFETG